MKKLLTSLLAVAMVLTMGATSVFADETETGQKDFGGVAPSISETWTTEDSKSQAIDLEVKLTDNGAASGFTGEARDAVDANPTYRVVVLWKKTLGTGTVNYQYSWNALTKQYVPSEIKTATVSTNPTLGVKIVNYSNASVNYQITLGEGHKFESTMADGLKVPSWANMNSALSLTSAAVDALGTQLATLNTTGTEQSVQYGTYVEGETEKNTTFYVESGSLNANTTDNQVVGIVTVTLSKIAGD